MIVMQGLNLLKVKNFFEQFPHLNERKSQLAGTLSGGEQQMLAMNRAQPSMGLPHLLVKEIFASVPELNKAGKE